MPDLCKRCGKPPLAEKAGSFTSYLFVHNYCQCQQKEASSLRPSLPAQAVDSTKTNTSSSTSSSSSSGNLEVCGRCGKALGGKERSGSFTSFLFKDLRCQCSVPIVAKPAAKRTKTSYRSTHKSAFANTSKQAVNGSFSSELNNQSTEALTIGTVIGGTFEIQSVIGSGGMGIVYAAKHLGLRRLFALKVLSPELVNEQTWKRFQAEAKTLGALNHNSLVNVFDLGIHAHSLPYYSMDLLEGRTLEQIIIDEGPLNIDIAIEIFLQVLDGLTYAHRHGIIHRDLKPGNIMICEVDGNIEVKILDFGISKFLQLGRQSQSLTMVGETFGSPFYMSPEQAVGSNVDARSDIYSIGCTLFEALTAYVPFDGSSQMEIMMMHEQDEPPLLAEVDPETEFPDSVEYVVARCLEKHPDDRYQSAKELAIDLEKIQENKYARTFFEDKKPFKSVSQRQKERDTNHGAANSSKRAIIAFSIVFILASIAATAAVIANFQSVLSIMPWAAKIENKAVSTSGFYSKLSEDGTTLEFNFPDYEIGLVNTSRKTLGSVPAKGKITFPIDKRIYFFTTAYSAVHPEIIKSFRPDDLYCYVARYRFENKAHLHSTLVNLKQLTGLKNLELAECELEDGDVDALNDLSFLKSIDLKNTNLGPSGLKKFELLRQVRLINYSLNKYIPELLEKIAGSTQLETLQLSTPDKPLTLADIKLLLTLKNLSQLNIENTGITDEMLWLLASDTNLTVLNAHGCKFSRETIEAVRDKYGKRLAISYEGDKLSTPINKNAKQSIPEFYQAK